MRLIDADALTKTLGITDMDCEKCEWAYKRDIGYTYGCSRGGDFEDACFAIEHAPTIEPERETGTWLPQDHNSVNGNISTCVYYLPICSECGKVGDFADAFCKHCGADMRGEQDEQT